MVVVLLGMVWTAQQQQQRRRQQQRQRQLAQGGC
jgi:preprotein translocase subunit YajC